MENLNLLTEEQLHQLEKMKCQIKGSYGRKSISKEVYDNILSTCSDSDYTFEDVVSKPIFKTNDDGEEVISHYEEVGKTIKKYFTTGENTIFLNSYITFEILENNSYEIWGDLMFIDELTK